MQDYDGQCGYLATTAIVYDLLAWQEKESCDNKTFGDLFYLMNDSLPDIKFIDALVYLLDKLKKIKGIETKNWKKQLIILWRYCRNLCKMHYKQWHN